MFDPSNNLMLSASEQLAAVISMLCNTGDTPNKTENGSDLHENGHSNSSNNSINFEVKNSFLTSVITNSF